MRVLERLSPDVAAIVQEIAQQPNSLLLTATPQMARRELFTPPDMVGSAAPFLSSAERELVGLYREEVANACYGTAALSLKRNVGGHDNLFIFINSRGDQIDAAQIADRIQLTRRLEADALKASANTGSALRLLADASPDKASPAEVIELLTVAQRLRPHLFAQVQGSLALAIGRNLPSSRLMATSASAEQSLPSVQGVALTNLGFAQHRSGLWSDATDSYFQAAKLLHNPRLLIDAAINAHLAHRYKEFREIMREVSVSGSSSRVHLAAHMSPSTLNGSDSSALIRRMLVRELAGVGFEGW